MKVFGRELSAGFRLCQQGDDILFGIDLTEGICEHCGNPVHVTRIGLGFAELDIFCQEGH